MEDSTIKEVRRPSDMNNSIPRNRFLCIKLGIALIIGIFIFLLPLLKVTGLLSLAQDGQVMGSKGEMPSSLGIRFGMSKEEVKEIASAKDAVFIEKRTMANTVVLTFRGTFCELPEKPSITTVRFYKDQAFGVSIYWDGNGQVLNKLKRLLKAKYEGFKKVGLRKYEKHQGNVWIDLGERKNQVGLFYTYMPILKLLMP